MQASVKKDGRHGLDIRFEEGSQQTLPTGGDGGEIGKYGTY